MFWLSSTILHSCLQKGKPLERGVLRRFPRTRVANVDLALVEGTCFLLAFEPRQGRRLHFGYRGLTLRIKWHESVNIIWHTLLR
jgi:hypothetical protein